MLADHMGLGKTLQVVAALVALARGPPLSRRFAHPPSPAALAASEEQAPFTAMIVCPATVLRNWKAEFKKWLRQEDLDLLHPTTFDTATVRSMQRGCCSGAGVTPPRVRSAARLPSAQRGCGSGARTAGCC